jgi:hypothetical protein
MGTMTIGEEERLSREILDLRIALAGELPPERRALLAAELQDLRLARCGVRTPPASEAGSTYSALAGAGKAHGSFGAAPPSGARPPECTSASQGRTGQQPPGQGESAGSVRDRRSGSGFAGD